MCNTEQKVNEYQIKELLKSKNQYFIPIYQRNYAWGKAEIDQLITDINDYAGKNEDYYIGTLVVFKRKLAAGVTKLEIIDGQQRFTTLTLLALVLKNKFSACINGLDMDWYKSSSLSFDSRKKSNLTLKDLSEKFDVVDLDSGVYNQDLIEGYNQLEDALNKVVGAKNIVNFCEFLFEKVKLVEVSVPEDTDLNHYFEAMNTRGEQLEKHEILKARFLSAFNELAPEDKKESYKALFSQVWEAVANMERYVQYGFDASFRKKVFGDDWQQFLPEKFEDLPTGFIKTKEEVSKLSSLLNTSPVYDSKSKETESDDAKFERFSSLTDFPNFLLQVLRLQNLSVTGKTLAKDDDISLDDKGLLKEFDKYFFDKKVKGSALPKLKEFTFNLLKVKFLYDSYIIKRDFSKEVEDWYLLSLKLSNDSPSYVNTFGQSEGDKNKQLILLLSAFHVSVPAKSYKHWLSGALKILYENNKQGAVVIDTYLQELEYLARKFMYGRFLAQGKKENESGDQQLNYNEIIYSSESDYQPLAYNYTSFKERLSYGKIQNNFVFNYVNYLIWRDYEKCAVSSGKENGTSKFTKIRDNFKFTFRSSVEHFAPQNPKDKTNDKKLSYEVLHSFGNLCLISHSQNSSLSNYSPVAKYEHYTTALAKNEIASLKLYLMLELMKAHENTWGEEEIKEHEEEVFNLLVKDSRQGK